ncbi:twin-arginine translocation signal domain-containing protein [Solwaraspora sp. WMMA2080]|uniref:twin-arginine translocation signal domain-containing protein n=1 Tax=unclassified Solwaraspora TaxID=2627926 RepID=UPI00248BBA4A|nr:MULTISPECIES: twin-arginine translocation signal domain-containing protein [unclassified Solwaraspora]WBB94917.1 twin-arginine translocation signal domain-containing protein [Solwaraspora sp. WMMA2059]WBC21200.1 twin-arginine translocation signal domain-containing protein [Solwaraspora sp. WMMA2080]
MGNSLSRRQLLGAAAVTGAAVAAAGAAQAAPTTPGTWERDRSVNGWPVLRSAGWHDIEGSGHVVALADGPAAVILTYVARRFHYEIDQLRAGDVHGHSTRTSLRAAYESNYLSGSALAIRPLAYPVGVRGGLYPREIVVVRDILAELAGVVAWGGDFDLPKESHFEIAYRPQDQRVTWAARRINGWAASPGGQGPGAIDAFDPARRARARSFAGS